MNFAASSEFSLLKVPGKTELLVSATGGAIHD
jgi:hypothetical protein